MDIHDILTRAGFDHEPGPNGDLYIRLPFIGELDDGCLRLSKEENGDFVLVLEVEYSDEGGLAALEEIVKEKYGDNDLRRGADA